MDYEKAYKEALELAKAGKPMDEVFPELKESEDEKIRKELIDAFAAYDIESSWNGIPVSSVLSWLEKQKELAVIPDELVKNYKLFCEQGGRESALLINAINGFNKQKEQKPAEWSEDRREEDIQTRFAFYTYKDDPRTLYLSNVFVEESSRNHGFGTRILRAAEKVAETVGATTISLKVKQDSLANAWYRKNGYGYVAFEDGYDWLEKNLEYMKPTKSAEWSEEDEKMLTGIIERGSSQVPPFEPALREEQMEWLMNLLKSHLHLRPHTVSIKNANKFAELEYERGVKDGVQSEKSRQWKPSEEQMMCLAAAIEESNNNPVLDTLYHALQKLL